MNNFKITENFTYFEMIASQAASRKGIDNTPNEEQLVNLTHWCVCLGQPLRNMVDLPVIGSSFFRSKLLNTEIGGAENSQHMLGQAGDIEVPGISNLDLYKIIRDHFVYDQLILEFHNPNIPDSGWVHASFNRFNNRMQSFTID